MVFYIYGIFGQTYGGNQARFEKQVSVSRKGVKNEAFPIKILAFKIFIFIVFQNHQYCQIFKKNMFNIFIASVPSIVYNDF